MPENEAGTLTEGPTAMPNPTRWVRTGVRQAAHGLGNAIEKWAEKPKKIEEIVCPCV